jgi:hypothetical protein
MTNIDHLSHTLQIWIRRMRLQRAALWTMRGLAAALALSLLIGGVGLYQAKLLKQEFLALVILFVILIPVLFGIVAYFWKVTPIKAARYFDREFHLEERVSTALELSGEDHSNQMIQKQLDDAVSASRGVHPRRDLPLRFKRVDALLALIFAVAIGALWFRGEALFTASSHQREVETAITQQQAKIEEIIKEINENDSLTDEQKQALTEPLQQAQQDLKETKSLEGAVSVLTTTGEKMQALSAEQGGETMQALKESGSSLASQEGSPLESVGKDLTNGDFAKAASDLNNMDLSQMSSEELQKLAQQLDAMAESLASSNPQMAQELKDAAQKIREGDLASAQQSLNNAAQQMAQVAQQAAASHAASQAASEMQSGAGQMLAAGGGQTVQAQGQGQGNQQGNNPTGQNNQGGAGGGSGSGDAPDSNQAGSEAGSSPIPQNNGAGDGGESAYEQIYAPPLLGGAGGDTLGLPTSGDSGEVIGTSPTTATDGQSLVPYSEVYGQYDQVNNQAIENGEVPVQFIDIVWSYFNSIQP